jgi:photosystem II stability/assembly factor-like uncharacterized protein
MRITPVIAALLVAASATTLAQAPQAPRDDAYVSRHRPRGPVPTIDSTVKDDPAGRREALREQFGGDFTPEFLAVVVSESNRQVEEYGVAGRGGRKPSRGGEWTSIGPEGSRVIENSVRLRESDTGRVRGFLVHPYDSDIVYILKSSGGLWKTTNFSARTPDWRPMTDHILSTSGGAVAFGRNPNTLFFGSGDPFDPGVGGALYRSTDGGRTWGPGQSLGFTLPGTPPQTFTASVIFDIKVDSSGPQDVVLVGTNVGLFRSTDGGATYGAVIAGGAHWSLQRTSAGWLSAITSGPNAFLGRAPSATGGWAIDPSVGGIAPAGRITLGVGAPGDAVVYAFAATTNSAVQKDLYRSTDGGLTFSPLGLPGKTPVNPNDDQPNLDIMAGQAFYNHMVLVDPSDPSRNTVYIGGQLSAAKSTDGGTTWQIITNWLAQFGLPYVHADHHAATVATVRGRQMLLFGTDGGLFTSDDGGQTFSSDKNQGMSSYLIYAMTGNNKDKHEVLIGLQDNGTRWRTGNSMNYNQVFGGDGFGVAWSQAEDEVRLGSVYYSFIIRSFKDPRRERRWEVGWNGIEEFFDPARTYFNTSLAAPRAPADPDGLTFFHRTRTRLYRTTDGAGSWQPVLNTGGVLLRAGSHPIGISPDDVRHFGVLGNGGNAWFTADAGATFTNRVLAGAAGGWPGFNSTLAYASNQTMYVGNEAPIGTTLRVIKSTDGGTTWTAASTGLPAVPVTKLLVSPRDPSGRTVFAATWIGVYQTTDGGASWRLFGRGLPLVNVSDLYIPTDGSYLRVSTYGRGVWQVGL